MDLITTSLITAFLLGLFSAVHCIAMCGSVIGALTLSLPAEIREQPTKMLPYVALYNIGRVLSYTLAGIIVALLLSPLNDIGGLAWLRYLAVVVMVAMGLYLAGWLPRFARIETLGAPLWRRLQPLGQKLLPVRSYSQALLFGMVWGWLPCGLVYAALAVAATTGSAVNGGLTMLAFGAGTLPAVMGAGMLTGLLASAARKPRVRQAAGLLIIVMAVASLGVPALMSHNSHPHHAAAIIGVVAHA